MSRARSFLIVAALGMITGVFWAASATGAAEKGPGAKKEPDTWIQVKGKVFGARPDKRGPIGGGKGYTQVVTGGDFAVKTLDGLLAALAKAKPGQVVFVDGRATLDCTERVPADKLVIEIPAGVTLASDRGHKGSEGAMIFSDWFATLPLIRAGGKGVRVTGIRLRGPDPKRRMAHHGRAFAGGRGSKYYYSFPISAGIDTRFPDLRVDNCEMSGWSHAAIYLRAGAGHKIHHNYIHHNQFNGLGYGVCLNTAEALIELNRFDHNRHSIAATGRTPSGYEAANNVELGTSLSHCFDMHGGRDRKDGTQIAGTWMKIHHNTFRAPQTPVVIRGTPAKKAEIHHNWFPNHGRKSPAAVHHSKNTVINNNHYGK